MTSSQLFKSAMLVSAASLLAACGNDTAPDTATAGSVDITPPAQQLTCPDGYSLESDICAARLVLVRDGVSLTQAFRTHDDSETVTPSGTGFALLLESAKTNRSGRGDTDGIRLQLDPTLFMPGTYSYELVMETAAPAENAADGYKVALAVQPTVSSEWMDVELAPGLPQTNTFEGNYTVADGDTYPILSIWPNNDGSPKGILLRRAELVLTTEPTEES